MKRYVPCITKGEVWEKHEIRDFMIFGNMLVLLSIDGCQIEYFDINPNKNQIIPR